MKRLTGSAGMRELFMRRIRRTANGMLVNREGCYSTKNKHLQSLLKKGLIKQVRRKWSSVGDFNRSLTYLIPADGIFVTDHVICPDCGSNLTLSRYWETAHTVNCSLRTDHGLDARSKSNRRMRQEELKRGKRSFKYML